MNQTFIKTIARTIWQSKGRFFSIMAIIALGVGFFSGLKVTKPGMVQTGNTYFDEHNMYDFRLLSTYGFDEDEVSAMRENANVRFAEGAYNCDFVYLGEDDEQRVLSAVSIMDNINTLEIREGRLPEKANECVVDAYMFSSDIIGKNVKIDASNTDETKDFFSYDTYTVVGRVNSPVYMNIERGTTTLGNGKVSAFVGMLPEGFDSEYYTSMYVKCEKTYDIYTDEYEDYIDTVRDDIEETCENAAIDRVRSLQQEADEAYDDAVQEAEEEIRNEIEKAVQKEMVSQKENLLANLVEQGLIPQQMVDSGLVSVDNLEATLESMVGMYPQLQPILDELAFEPDIDTMVADKLDEVLADVEKIVLDDPEIFALDRSTNIGYMCYDNDTNIVAGVAKVFPIFFFLIAALVCSTTMTRMIDDERGQIGTFRALGYNNATIMSKYMIYSGSSAIIGCVGGFFLGTWLFPYVISEAYKMLYDFGDGVEYYYSPGLLVICIIVSLICSMGTTYLACYRELLCMPADLIRPKAPIAGKRILLERITFLWKRMKFLHKVTARNVFRFKKRMLMMIVGIAGCTALVLTGFGVKDSVSDLAEFQFGEIDIYDIEVTFKENTNASDIEEVNDLLEEENRYMLAYKTSMEYHMENAIKTLNLVAANGEDFEDYIHFQMQEGEGYPGLGEVMLSNKIAEMANVSVGDTITLTDSNSKDVTLTVSGIFKNYVWHYAYVTPETYEKYFGNIYGTNTMYLCTRNDKNAYELGAKLNKLDAVLAVSVVAEVKDRVSNMMTMMNAVVGLVIGSAGALAFIVLFNLSNINITERVREIATIKVLGFFSGETGAYVFRENLVLTLMGIVVGLPLGKLLHSFVMSQIQVDMVAFAVNINQVSYLLTVVAVLLFLVVVDLVMRRKIEVIDMAESLKSIE